MAASLRIDLDPTRVAALSARLGRVAAVATLRPSMARSLARLQGTLAAYPPQSHKPQPPKTDRQRRKLFALIREGKVPYQRTGHLGESWVAEIVESGTSLDGTLTNGVRNAEGVAYGPLVQGGPGEQAAYFEGSGWATVAAAIAEHQGAIEEDFASATQAALDE